ncbi:MAG: hypothetical protein L3V56_01300 [Candidatus Magnetoovum sp. WYHC-5]|nr:hypothetical protein [Candidatus Magnetoovum sp. WYHC-5]
MKKIFKRKITLTEVRDAGMVVVFILLIIAYWQGSLVLIPYAIFFLFINMLWPTAYKPVAILWFGLANILNIVMSKVLLSIVFFVLVVPVGLIRRVIGADSLQLKKWKKGDVSAFSVRNHKYSATDMERPY